jgi:beta-glucosidase
VDAARYSSVVIAAMGLDGSQEYEDSTRATLSLPGAQDALLSALAATGVPVVLVIFGGSAVVPLPSTLASMSAVVWAGYGGEEAGTALADVLLGVYNPGGRLPFTFFQSADDLPPYLNMSMTGLPFGRTYRYFTGPAPVFRFGEGYSYATFTLSGLVANRTSLSPCDGLRLSVDASAGAGGPDGDTVVQVYARLRGLALTTPRMALVAHQRISLAAGAPAMAVSFDIAPGAFAVVKEDGNATTWWQYPSTVDLLVGEVSPADEAAWSGPLSVTLTLGGPAGGTKLSTC